MVTTAWWERRTEELLKAWNEQRDISRAVQLAREVQPALERTHELGAAIPAIHAALEPLWDAAETRNTREARDLAGEYRQIAANVAPVLPPDAAREVLVDALTQSARAWHRADKPEVAYGHVKAAQRMQLRWAGDPERLRKRLAADPLGDLAAERTALLAIGIPVFRLVARTAPAVAAASRDALIDEAKSVLENDPVPDHPRIHALIVQLLNGIVERGDSRDLPFVERLVLLDALWRPRHARGQATRHLVPMVKAKFIGDGEDEHAHALVAAIEIASAALPRHIDALNARAWWPLAPAA